jgi:hypothetical protein
MPTKPNTDDPKQILWDARFNVARAFFIGDYLMLPKEGEYSHTFLAEKALEKLPKSGPITAELDIMAVGYLWHLLDAIVPSNPQLPSFRAAYKSALNRVPA